MYTEREDHPIDDEIVEIEGDITGWGNVDENGNFLEEEVDEELSEVDEELEETQTGKNKNPLQDLLLAK